MPIKQCACHNNNHLQFFFEVFLVLRKLVHLSPHSNGPIIGLPQDGGLGNPREILHFQVFKCQFPYPWTSIRSQIPHSWGPQIVFLVDTNLQCINIKKINTEVSKGKIIIKSARYLSLFCEIWHRFLNSFVCHTWNRPFYSCQLSGLASE